MSPDPQKVYPALPPELVETLSTQSDPWSLYGHAQAEVLRLNRVVTHTLDFLGTVLLQQEELARQIEELKAAEPPVGARVAPNGQYAPED